MDEPRLVIARTLWSNLLLGLHLRTEGEHESGAFLLGRLESDRRRVERIVFYDELDPDAYLSGVVILYGDSFGQLWDLCADAGLAVVADIHVHGLSANQSRADRENPMVATSGHIALIVPWLAKPPVEIQTLGFYEYLGDHRWRNFSGTHAKRCLLVEP